MVTRFDAAASFVLTLGVLTVAWCWRLRHHRTRGRVVVGFVAGAVSGVLGWGGGLHMCNAGEPPFALSLLLGAMVAALVAVSVKTRVWLPLVTTVGSSFVLPFWLAGEYHRIGPELTGSPEFAAGRFWHTPLTGVYVARWRGRLAESDGDCEVERCRIEGTCVRDGQTCIATSSGQCRASLACSRDGRCTAMRGFCIAASAEDCRRSELCTSWGACVPSNGRCVEAPK